MAELKAKAGLEDVVATDSSICFIDGDRGVLSYRGYDIHDLARYSTFEETCYLLWHGRLPVKRRARRSAVAAGGGAAAARGGPAADEDAAAGGRDGRAAHAGLGAGALRSRRPRQLGPARRTARRCGSPAQVASLVATWGRLQAGGGPIAPGPGAGPCRQLPLHAHRRAPRRDRRARDGRRADAARRPRAERLDLRRARRRRDAHRHPLGGRRRHRHAQGAAARRRQRRSDEDAARAREGRHARARRRVRARQARSARRRSRASATASTRPRTRGPRTCAQMSRELGARAGQPQVVRDVRADRGDRQGREEAESERRLLLGLHLLHDGHPDRALHADLRGEPHIRLDRARAGAAGQQPSDPAAGRVHRSGLPAVVAAARTQR